MYPTLLFYPCQFPFDLLVCVSSMDYLMLRQSFWNSMLVLLGTWLHFVHSMLGLRLVWQCFNKRVGNLANVTLGLQLTWLCKVYRKPKIFFTVRALHDGSLTCLTLQSLSQTRNLFHSSCTPCWVSDLLGGVLINMGVNLVNVMLGLRLLGFAKFIANPKSFFYILCIPCWVSNLLSGVSIMCE